MSFVNRFKENVNFFREIFSFVGREVETGGLRTARTVTADSVKATPIITVPKEKLPVIGDTIKIGPTTKVVNNITTKPVGLTENYHGYKKYEGNLPTINQLRKLELCHVKNGQLETGYDFVKNLLKHSNILGKSKMFRIMIKDGKPVIKTKIPLKGSTGEIPVGSEIKMHGGSMADINCKHLNPLERIEYNKKTTIKIPVEVNGNYNEIFLDFENVEDRFKAMKILGKYAHGGDFYDCALPDLAVIMSKSVRR